MGLSYDDSAREWSLSFWWHTNYFKVKEYDRLGSPFLCATYLLDNKSVLLWLRWIYFFYNFCGATLANFAKYYEDLV